MFSLSGKKALVVGIANEESIAYGCAESFREQGAELAVTYLNDRAEPYVRPLAEKLDAKIILPLDVREDGQFDIVWNTDGPIRAQAWSPFIPDSAEKVADWTYPWVCGNCETPSF